MMPSRRCPPDEARARPHRVDRCSRNDRLRSATACTIPARVMTVTERADARPLSPNDPRLEPWRSFLTAHARVTRRLDEELRAEHDLSLAEYDAMLTIADAPERRIRMRQLADRVILSKSGVTRLIDRLVLDGLVERKACASDARGAEAVLTAEGLDRLRRASRTHLRGIAEHFLAAVDEADLPAIERSMQAVAEHAGPAVTPPTDPRAGRPRGRLYVGTSGFAYPGLEPAVLPARSEGRRAARPLRLAPARGRAQQHVLPVAVRVEGRHLARGLAARLPVQRQGAAWRVVAGDERRARARASHGSPTRIGGSASGSGPCCSASPTTSDVTMTACGDARRVAARVAADGRVRRPELGRRRDGRRSCARRARSCAPPKVPTTRYRPRSGAPGHSCMSACAAMTTRPTSCGLARPSRSIPRGWRRRVCLLPPRRGRPWCRARAGAGERLLG